MRPCGPIQLIVAACQCRRQVDAALFDFDVRRLDMETLKLGWEGAKYLNDLGLIPREFVDLLDKELMMHRAVPSRKRTHEVNPADIMNTLEAQISRAQLEMRTTLPPTHSCVSPIIIPINET